MTDNREALDNILKAINNIVEPTVKKLKYDKTFRGKVMSVLENGRYEIQVNGASYTLPYSETLEVNDVVRVRVPLNNFSDAYIEPTGSSGGSSGGTTDYDELINRPYLNTNNSSSLTVNSSELLQNTISLHRVSKTGRYSDLIGTPSLDFIPNSQLGVAGGVATLDTNGVLDGGQLPSGVVIDASYVHTDNNFTTTLLNKLNGIENNAEVNVIESVAVNNSTLPISNKRVNITVPTQLSDLENDLSFATQNYVDTSVQGVENQIPTQTSQLQNNGEGTSPFLTSIPVASTTALGGIKVGDNLSIEADGTLSALGGGTDSLPVGVSMEWYTSTPPTNWLICDGSMLDISEYPELFAVLGTTFGGDGTTDFALPDRRGRFGVGYSSTDTDFAKIGRVGGSKEHTLTVSELATHTHIQNAHTHTQSAHTHTLNSHTHSFSATTSNRGAHTHTGRYLGMNVSSGGVGSYLLRRISDDDSYQGTSQITNSAGNHTHTVSGTTGGASGNTSSTTATNNSTTATNQNTGDSEPFSILNPYFVVNYIIKAK